MAVPAQGSDDPMLGLCFAGHQVLLSRRQRAGELAPLKRRFCRWLWWIWALSWDKLNQKWPKNGFKQWKTTTQCYLLLVNNQICRFGHDLFLGFPFVFVDPLNLGREGSSGPCFGSRYHWSSHVFWTWNWEDLYNLPPRSWWYTAMKSYDKLVLSHNQTEPCGSEQRCRQCRWHLWEVFGTGGRSTKDRSGLAAWWMGKFLRPLWVQFQWCG